MTKPATLIRQFVRDDPASAVGAVLDRVPGPGMAARCMNPACKKSCTWAEKDRGRAPKFCSDGCRLTFARRRTLLGEELAAYVELRANAVADRAQLVQLDRRISLLRMQLVRYPSS